MNAKHTPGPWRVGDAGRTVFGRNEGALSPVTVATLPAVAHPSRIDERRANACLIASSPRLLAALERLALRVEDITSHGPGATREELIESLHRGDDGILREARLAISSAKGV